MQAGREPELGHTEVLRTEPMDRPRRGAKGYGTLLIAGWVIICLMDLVAGLGVSEMLRESFDDDEGPSRDPMVGPTRDPHGTFSRGEQHPYSSTSCPKAPQHPPFLRSTLAARRRGALTVPSAAISSKARATEKVGGRAMPEEEACCLQPSSVSKKNWKTPT